MATKKEDVKFEDNLAELENIVRKLESGDVALEDAIAKRNENFGNLEKNTQ